MAPELLAIICNVVFHFQFYGCYFQLFIVLSFITRLINGMYFKGIKILFKSRVE